ncbi:heterokaryon incompatibility protein-domain-containing protein [Xylaria longipes]|nr:heterokaryon incompatibility protein-domain-containing protein [Xylaria longipes]
MSVPQLPNGLEGLNGLGGQTGASRRMTSTATIRTRVAVPKRQKEIAVGPDRLKYWDQPTSDKKTRDEIAKRFLGATERWKLLEKYDLLYKYSLINSTQIRLLYLNPARRYEDDIFVELVPIEDENTGSEDASQQAYEALSYHWGPGPADKPIYVYGLRSNIKVDMADFLSLRRIVPDYAKGQRLYVRPNLDKALRNLRDKTTTVVLWVDAICINQPDEKIEKPAQIAKMKHIYNKASNVCIWLGDGKGESDKDRSKDFYAAMAFSRTILDLGRFEELLHESHTKKWSDLLDLMRCSWFSRRWVIQELALAREATVHCGTECVSWQDFADAIGLFVLNFDKIRGLFARSRDENVFRNFTKFNELEPLGAKVLVDAITNTFRKSVDGTVFEPVFNLETLVSSLASFESSDPRDSIFALLNIASESMLPPSEEMDIVMPPKPNYERDLLEVYTDLLEWVVHSTGSLDMICRQWAAPERTKPGGRKNPTRLVTLPSWIQTIQKSTWGTQEQGLNGRINGDSLVGKPGRRRYNASHGRKPEVRFGARWRVVGVPANRVNSAPAAPSSIKPLTSSPITAFLPTNNTTLPPNTSPSHRLHVKGIMIGSIKWTSSPIARGVITRACCEKGGWRIDGQPKHKVPDKLWRTMVADRDADGNNTPPWYHRAALHAMALADNNGDLATQELLDKGDMAGRRQPQIVTEFLKRVQGVTWNRKFIEGILDNPKTDDAEPLFGISSPETECGDIICILFGCSVPCILRPYGPGQRVSHFEFIGEAYIYGRMDGEEISILSADELREKTVDFVIV